MKLLGAAGIPIRSGSFIGQRAEALGDGIAAQVDAETKTTDGDDNDQRHDEREPTELVSPHEQPDIQRKHPAEDEQVRSHETQTDGRDARDRKRAEQHADGERSGCRGEHDTKQCRVSRGHGDGPRIVEQPRRANDAGNRAIRFRRHPVDARPGQGRHAEGSASG